MAADEVLLESAAAGIASLRFYGWSEATLSLGYFQPERRRLEDERLVRLPFVRRPSGGDTLVHHHELTYALGLPRGAPWQNGGAWPRRMHRIVAAALVRLGVPVRLYVPVDPAAFRGVLCFQHFTTDDLVLGTAKITGSAQRKQRGALLQHGSILLAASPHTPALPGIRELSGRELSGIEVSRPIGTEFVRETGWELVPADWTERERQRRDEIARTRYSQDSWNRKR
jgi:lipoate-protein ligase A